MILLPSLSLPPPKLLPQSFSVSLASHISHLNHDHRPTRTRPSSLALIRSTLSLGNMVASLEIASPSFLPFQSAHSQPFSILSLLRKSSSTRFYLPLSHFYLAHTLPTTPPPFTHSGHTITLSHYLILLSFPPPFPSFLPPPHCSSSLLFLSHAQNITGKPRGVSPRRETYSFPFFLFLEFSCRFS